MDVIMKYEFTNNWFKGDIFGRGPEVDIPKVWSELLPPRNIKTVLEIGSWEGQSTCFLIEMLGNNKNCTITSIDKWDQKSEPSTINMSEIEERFDSNVKIALNKCPNSVSFKKIKTTSFRALAELIYRNQLYDLIYIDGSHHSIDVLSDLVMASHLVSSGGLIICDDYLWDMGFRKTNNPNATPKPAVDAFCNIFYERFQVIRNVPIYQLFIEKTR